MSLRIIRAAVGAMAFWLVLNTGLLASTFVPPQLIAPPSPTTAGTVYYWNGTAWLAFSGNTSGSQCFGESSSGVPSWVGCSGGGGGTPGGISGQIQYNNGGVFGGFTAGGDLTFSVPNFTLNTVNSGPGSFGSATATPVITVNGKGLVTASSSTTITPAIGSITGLGTGVGTILTQTANATGGLTEVSATPTVGHCLDWTSSGIADAGGACTTGGGGGTVSSGTAGQVTYYAATGTTVSGNTDMTISAGALSLGASAVQGSVVLNGATSGSTTLVPTAVAGSTTATLPANSGTVAELNLAQTFTATQTFPSGSITNAELANSTISGISLGSNLATLTISSPLTGTSYNGSSAVSIGCSTCLTGLSFPLTVSGTTTSGGIPYFSSTTVLSSSALLASGKIVTGGGAGTAPSTDANAGLSAGALSLGASGTVGSVALGNATSGTVTLQPVTGALGSVTASLPANTGTIAELNLAQTWSAVQTFNTSNLIINGGTATAGLATSTAAGVISSEANATVAQGGTNCTTASGTCLDNITAFSSTGLIDRTGAGTYSFTAPGTGVLSALAANLNTSGGIVSPTPAAAGDLIYWNGSAWTKFAGNSSGSQVLTESSAGVPSWTTPSGSGTVTSVAPGAGISTTAASGGSTAITSSGTVYLDASYIQNYLGGLQLSNDGTTPNSVLDIAAGSATDSTNTYVIKIGAFTKSTAGAWASGSGSNGMGNGLTIAASTWYHVCLGYNAGTPDVWFDTSAVCANKPSGISGSQYRRIGSFKTNGSSNILAFTQLGNEFVWAAPIVEQTNAVPPTTATLFTLAGVPTGVKVKAELRSADNCTVTGVSCSATVLFQSPDETSAVSNATGGNVDVDLAVGNTAATSTISTGVPFERRTNTSAQLRWSAAGPQDANLGVYLVTFGWIDPSLGSPGGGTSSGVTSVSNSDGTITATPTTGSVVLSLALGHANTWTAAQTFAEVLSTVSTQSGTTYTLANSDCGTEIAFSSSSAVTVTIPATLPVGCNVSMVQTGTAKVSVNGSAVTPATLHSAHSYTGTFAQWSVIGINIESNVGGSSAIAVLIGDGS
jgi:hypothetical protein